MATQKSRPVNNRAAPSSGRQRARNPGGNRNRSSGSANAKTSFDRYTELASAAARSGDVVLSEHYFQHAEHFFRLMKEKMA